MLTTVPIMDSLGFGVGLRPEHFDAALNQELDIDWFEILSEDYFVAGGALLQTLDALCERYPMVMHGVSLSIGSVDPLNTDYLRALKRLADRVKPRWISDHVCWTGVNGVNSHDLLPLPYTEETLAHMVPRITDVQAYLGRPLVLENVSSYITYKHSEMTEWEFLVALSQRSGCHLLLDVNNVYVSAFNHGFDPEAYINAIPVNAVQQCHLAGHMDKGTHKIDTHDQSICEDVWALYEKVMHRFPNASVLIERDGNMPPIEALIGELTIARELAHRVCEVET